MTKVDKAVYKCPCCSYCTHFPKALEAHQRFRKHFAATGGTVKAEEPHLIGDFGKEMIVPEGQPLNIEINGDKVTPEEVVEEIEKSLKKAVKETEKKPRAKKAAKE